MKKTGKWIYKIERGQPYRTAILTPKGAWWCALVGQCGYEARKIVKALNAADAAKVKRKESSANSPVKAGRKKA